MSDEEWILVILRLRVIASEMKTIKQIAQSFGISAPTMKTILMGKKPSFLTQIRLVRWINQQERKLKLKP